MGFNAELRILYPDHKLLGQDKTLWKAQEVISFGYVTRLQKLVEYPKHHYGDHERAGICVVGCIMAKLVEKLGRGPIWPDFAPLFLIYEAYFEDHAAYSLAKTTGVLDYIDAGSCFEFSGQDRLKPSPKLKKGHNEILGWSQDRLNAYVANNYNIIVHPLIMWESCENITAWLDEAEKIKTPEWQELEKNPISLAKARAWREYLREVGKIGARALFLFPM